MIWPGVVMREGSFRQGSRRGPLRGCTAGGAAGRASPGGWNHHGILRRGCTAGGAAGRASRCTCRARGSRGRAGGGPAGARARLRRHHPRRIASTRPVAGAGWWRERGVAYPIPPPYAALGMTPGRPPAGGHAQVGRTGPAVARRAARLAWARAVGRASATTRHRALRRGRPLRWAGIVAPGRSRPRPFKALRQRGEAGGALNATRTDMLQEHTTSRPRRHGAPPPPR